MKPRQAFLRYKKRDRRELFN